MTPFEYAHAACLPLSCWSTALPVHLKNEPQSRHSALGRFYEGGRECFGMFIVHCCLVIYYIAEVTDGAEENIQGGFFDWSALKMTKYEEKLKYLNWSANCSS